jgi:methyl-accepting chemotaxis protein
MLGKTWFNNRSITVKVLAAVSTGLAALLVVGSAGLLALGAVSRDARTLYSHSVRQYAALADLRDMEGDTRWMIRDYALAGPAADTAKMRADMKETDQQLDADIATYLAVGGGSLGKRGELMLEFKSRLATFRSIRDTKVLPAVDQQDMASERLFVNGDLSQADDAMGVPLDQLLDLEQSAAKAENRNVTSTADLARALLVLAIVLGAVVASGLGLLVARRIARPVRDVMRALEKVSVGDLTGNVEVTSTDEVGRMGEALNVAIAALRRTVGALSRSAASVTESSSTLTVVSQEMSASAQQVSQESTTVSAAAEEISSTVQSVASGAEEIGASIREIARNTSAAATVADGAVRSAQAAAASVTRLGTSSEEIGNVAALIRGIAQQTNLLALNATIEASRAGEAGRGFAVVAQEVKQLAQETAAATDEITRQIEVIQGDTSGVTTAITEMGVVIGQINDFTTTIAAAVEQQSATTAEMARSVAEAAGSTVEIARSMSGLADSAAVTSASLVENQLAADSLSAMSGELAELVSEFVLD